MNFLQIIYDLQRYKNYAKFEEAIMNHLDLLYNRLVEQYFKLLSN